MVRHSVTDTRWRWSWPPRRLPGTPSSISPDGPPAEVIEELFDVLLDDLTGRGTPDRRDASLSAPGHPAAAGGRARRRPGQDVESAWRTLRDLPFTSTTRSGSSSIRCPHRRSPAGWRSATRLVVAAVRRRAAGPRCGTRPADPELGGHRRSALPRPEPGHPQQLPAAGRSAAPGGAAAVATTGPRFWRSPSATTGRRVRRSIDRLVAHRIRRLRGRPRPDGEVTAFSVLSPGCPRWTSGWPRVDPVLAAFLADVRAGRPLPAARCPAAPPGAGAAPRREPSPELGAMVVDIKRRYLELRPRWPGSTPRSATGGSGHR